MHDKEKWEDVDESVEIEGWERAKQKSTA